MIPALLLPLLPLVGPLLTSTQDNSGVPDDVFAPASADLVLVVDAAGESETMLAVIEEYARLTSQPVAVDASSREYLAQVSTGLMHDVVVPPAGVQSFVEGLLANYGCSLVVRPGAPRSILIQTPRSDYRNWVREGALQVAESDLAAWKEYPATQIRCTVTMEHEDARQVANSLRAEMTDNNRQMIISLGTGRAILISGGARWVGDIAASIHTADAAVGAGEQSEFERIVLNHAVAADTAPLLQELLDAANGRRSGPQQSGQMPSFFARVVADERTNSLLVVGSREDLAAAKSLIAGFDVQASAR